MVNEGLSVSVRGATLDLHHAEDDLAVALPRLAQRIGVVEGVALRR